MYHARQSRRRRLRVLSGRTRRNGLGCCQRRGKNMMKHGLCGTKLYNVWQTMEQRCYNPRDRHYHWYGAKGVKVCNQWLNDSTAFGNWCNTNSYEEGLTIDRIDSCRNYCPENCRFITMSVQQRNRSSNKRITSDGLTLMVQEWAEKLNITPSTSRSRFNKGWSIKRVLTEPAGSVHY